MYSDEKSLGGRWLLLGLGFALIIAAAIFLWAAYVKGLAPQSTAVEINQGVITLLLSGLAAILCAELLPLLRNIKFGGVEVEFRDLGVGLTTDIQGLEARVAKLELAAAGGGLPAQPGGALAAAAEASTLQPAPEGLDDCGVFANDLRKGKFGGSPVAAGLRLRAEFPGPRDARWTRLVLIVEPEKKGGDMSDVHAVEFFLHDSFDEPRMIVPVRDGKATLSLRVWGGFTVGVWVGERQATLELDLSEIKTAPRIIREL